MARQKAAPYVERDESDISGYDPLEGLDLGKKTDQEDEESDDGLEVDPEDVLSESDTEEYEEEEEEAPAPPAQPQYNPNADPNVAWARARILEKERDTYKQRLEMMFNALQQQAKAVPQEEEEESDEYLAPDEKAAKLSEKALREIESMKKQQIQLARHQQLQQVIGVADSQIAQFAQQNPQYTNAIAHLAYIEMDEFLDENPGLTPQEAEEKVLEKTMRDKIKWLQAGKNPGVELWKRAVRRGYQPMVEYDDAEQEIPMPAPQQSKPQVNEVDQIKKKREKMQSVKTISSVQGAQGRSSINAKTLAKMPEEQFLGKIAELTRASGTGRAPRFHELLAGKGQTSPS